MASSPESSAQPPRDDTVRCACLMMQKNEADLLRPWVLYHGRLFGFHNLFVFDNGSSEPAALDALDRAAQLGANVDRSHDQKLDFVRKGEVLGRRMREMRDQGGWDVLIPLDCDEFLAVRDGDGVSFEPRRILAGLSTIRDDDRVPHVLTAYMNVLGTIDRFRPESCLKTFVQARGFVDLDHGFHGIRSSLSEVPMDSGFVYVHCHAKPFERVVRDAREKLAFWCDVDSPDAVDRLELANGAGWHLVKYLRMTEREYLDTFGRAGAVELPGFARRLVQVGADIGFLLGERADAAVIPVGSNPAWVTHLGQTMRRSGNGVMVFGEQGPDLTQLMRALGAAGLDLGHEAELYLHRHWVTALKSGDAERIRRELLILAAQPRPWASWFPRVGLLTAEMAEAMRWPRAIQIVTEEDVAEPDCAALRGLGLPVLQLRWDAPTAEPGLLAETILAYLGIDAGPERVAGCLGGAVGEGWIDGFTETEVSGWCWLRGSDARQSVVLLVDGVERAQVAADGFREDLVAAGIGDGRHAFRFMMEPGWIGVVEVGVVGSGMRLPGGGVRITSDGDVGAE